MAVTAIAGTTVGGYLVVRGNHLSLGSALAVALQPASHAMSVLEQQREQLIVMDSAVHKIHIVGSPKLAALPSTAPAAGGTAGQTAASFPPPNPGTAQAIAYKMMPSFGFNPKTQFGCLDNIWTRESNWRYNAANASGAYGIPQALPGSKMASSGADWQTNPATQINWGLGYIKRTYGTPCNAWGFWQAHGWY